MKKQTDTSKVKILLAMPVELKTITDDLAKQANRSTTSYLRSLIIRQAFDKHMLTPEMIDKMIDTTV